MATTRPLVLAYHAISSSWRSTLATPLAVLTEHLELLRRKGYVGTTFSASERLRNNGNLHEKTVVVTFDDGFKSVLAAKPVMDEYDFPATVFVVTDFVGSARPLSWQGIERWTRGPTAPEMEPLNWSDLEYLRNAGWEIGSHTDHHPLLVALSDNQLTHELAASRALLTQRLGDCDTVAYPYGIADDRVVRITTEAGYTAACTLMRLQAAEDGFRRARIGLSGADTGLRARLQLSPTLFRLRTGRIPGTVRRLHFHRPWLPPTPTTPPIDEIES